jgi:hypothetical protein
VINYYRLIGRAIANLDDADHPRRAALYERARAALVTELGSVTPPLSQSDIAQEYQSLEEAIDKLETEASQRRRTGVWKLPIDHPKSELDAERESPSFAGVATDEKQPVRATSLEPALASDPDRQEPTDHHSLIPDLPPITAQGLKSFRDSVAQVDRPDEAPTARSELYHDRRVPNGDLIGPRSKLGRPLSPQIPFIADHRGNPVRSSLPPPPVPSHPAPMRRRSVKVQIAALLCVLIALAAVIYWQRNRLNVWFVRDSGVVGQYQITAAAGER